MYINSSIQDSVSDGVQLLVLNSIDIVQDVEFNVEVLDDVVDVSRNEISLRLD